MQSPWGNPLKSRPEVHRRSQRREIPIPSRHRKQVAQLAAHNSLPAVGLAQRCRADGARGVLQLRPRNVSFRVMYMNSCRRLPCRWPSSCHLG